MDIALYDPVSPPLSEWPELLEAFIALSRKHSGSAAWYQVKPETIQVYVDANLSLMKVGEQAWLDLDELSIEGAHRSHVVV